MFVTRFPENLFFFGSSHVETLKYDIGMAILDTAAVATTTVVRITTTLTYNVLPTKLNQIM